MLFRLLAAMAALFLAAQIQAAEAEKVFHVGITAFRDKSVTSREWEPTMAYLSSRIPGSRFVAVPMNLPEFEIALGRKDLDFVITNPEHYILMETLYGVSRVATLVKSEDGKQVNRFGGVIFTRSDRQDIRRLDDARGKTIASVDRTSFAAFLLQYDLFKQQDIDPDRECRVQFLGFPQDLSVKAVLEGRADIGFVRTGVLEAMAREGKISLSQVRILNQVSSPGFPFLLSTDLFPEWPFAVAPHVPVDITNQVTAALLLMPPEDPAARTARYYRWSTPVEYQSVQNLMRRHRIYPYDQPEAFTFHDVLRQYAGHILLLMSVLMVAMAALYVRTRRLNKALKISRRQLRRQAHHDPLTGLPNRNMLDHDLEKALARAKRTGLELAVCLIDLDGFKPINDCWGHKVGDDVLREVARRLQGILRSGDTVARWGGDEFVLLVSGISAAVQLEEIMERVLAAVSQPLHSCPGATVQASIGVSLYPSGADSVPELIKRADQAMYQVKKQGGNRFAVHSGLPGESFPSSLSSLGKPAGARG